MYISAPPCGGARRAHPARSDSRDRRPAFAINARSSALVLPADRDRASLRRTADGGEGVAVARDQAASLVANVRRVLQRVVGRVDDLRTLFRGYAWLDNRKRNANSAPAGVVTGGGARLTWTRMATGAARLFAGGTRASFPPRRAVRGDVCVGRQALRRPTTRGTVTVTALEIDHPSAAPVAEKNQNHAELCNRATSGAQRLAGLSVDSARRGDGGGPSRKALVTRATGVQHDVVGERAWRCWCCSRLEPDAAAARGSLGGGGARRRHAPDGGRTRCAPRITTRPALDASSGITAARRPDARAAGRSAALPGRGLPFAATERAQKKQLKAVSPACAATPRGEAVDRDECDIRPARLGSNARARRRGDATPRVSAGTAPLDHAAAGRRIAGRRRRRGIGGDARRSPRTAARARPRAPSTLRRRSEPRGIASPAGVAGG